MNKKILVQTIIISFIYLLVLFTVQNFKKFLHIQSYDVQFLDPKWPISQNKIMSLVSFIHAYLHSKNQSQILIYYWNIAD